MQKNIGRVFQQAVAGSAEFAASQAKQWYANEDLASHLGQSLESLKSVEIRDLLGAFGKLHLDMVSQVSPTVSGDELIFSKKRVI